MNELLEQILELGRTVDSASQAAMLQTVTANMQSLQLVLDDSHAAQSLSLQLSSALSQGPLDEVQTHDVIFLNDPMISISIEEWLHTVMRRTISHRHVQ
jgi:hypothetical protein